MPEKTLIEWLQAYGIEVSRSFVKDQLIALDEWYLEQTEKIPRWRVLKLLRERSRKKRYPLVRSLPPYERAKKLLEFLEPRYKLEENETPVILILQPKIKGYVAESWNFEDFIRTRWGNCVSFSVLYTILAEELDLKSNVYFVNGKAHVVCYVTIDNKRILVDTIYGIFDKTPSEGYRKMNLQCNYQKNCFLVENKFVAMWLRALRIGLGKEKGLEELKKLCGEFVEKYPQSLEGWLSMGNVRISAKEAEEANRCFDKALEITPEDPEAWYEKAAVLKILGRDEEAMACIKRARRLAEKYGYAKLARELAAIENGGHAIKFRLIQ